MRPTPIRHAVSADVVGSPTAFGLTPELAARARSRIGWVAVFLGALNAWGGISALITWWFFGAPTLPTGIAGCSCAILGAVLWRVARGRRLGDVAVFDLSLAFLVVVCLSTAWSTATWQLSITGPCRGWTGPYR